MSWWWNIWPIGAEIRRFDLDSRQRHLDVWCPSELFIPYVIWLLVPLQNTTGTRAHINTRQRVKENLGPFEPRIERDNSKIICFFLICIAAKQRRRLQNECGIIRLLNPSYHLPPSAVATTSFVRLFSRFFTRLENYVRLRISKV